MGEPRPVLPYAGPLPKEMAARPQQFPPPAAPPSMPPAALTTEQLRDLAAAKIRMKGIRRAVRTAQFDGVTMAVGAALTLMGGLFGAGGLIAGVVLGAIAGVELWAASRLRRLDGRAPAWLAINQAVLAGALILYATWQLIHPAPLPPEYSDPNLKALGMDLKEMATQMNQVLYGGIIAFAVLVQGSLIVFYLRRKPMVAKHLALTPHWVRDLQAAGIDV